AVPGTDRVVESARQVIEGVAVLVHPLHMKQLRIHVAEDLDSITVASTGPHRHHALAAGYCVGRAPRRYLRHTLPGQRVGHGRPGCLSTPATPARSSVGGEQPDRGSVEP